MLYGQDLDTWQMPRTKETSGVGKMTSASQVKGSDQHRETYDAEEY